MVKISITTQNKKEIPFDRRFIRNLSRYVFKKTNFLKRGKNVIIDITFLSKGEMRRLNFKYRGIDRTTSSLAFSYGSPSPDEKIYIGEILLNEDLLKKKSHKFGEVLIHALLHLAGYDHSKPSERKTMFKIQEEIIKELGEKKWVL